MPKVDLRLLDTASMKAIGSMRYVQGTSSDIAKHKRFRELSGITKGQWKRMQQTWWKYRDGGMERTLIASELSIKKLEVMAEYGESPHLETLLKVVEARGVDDDPR